MSIVNKNIGGKQSWRAVYRGDYDDTPDIASLVIEEGVMEIGEGAFRDFRNLTSITLPASLQVISPAAFSGCSSLRSVTFARGVQTLSDEAFFGCSSLVEVVMPDTVVRIGEGCFEGCASLSRVRFSEALTLLPLFTSAAVPGLTVGCVVANIFSSVTPLDMVIGSLATLLYYIGLARGRD